MYVWNIHTYSGSRVGSISVYGSYFCVFVQLRMYVCMYVCMYVTVCMYVCMYVYTHTVDQGGKY